MFFFKIDGAIHTKNKQILGLIWTQTYTPKPTRIKKERKKKNRKLTVLYLNIQCRLAFLIKQLTKVYSDMINTTSVTY